MMRRGRHEDLEARVHRALSSVSRVRILQLLREGPHDVAEIAAATGLHANTIRTHLGVLERADLVARDVSRPRRPGRPPNLFRLADPPAEPPSRKRYEALTQVLVASLRAVSDDPVAVAEQAGRPLGRSLVDGDPPTTLDEALERVVAILDDLGFDPQLRTAGSPPQVVLRRCPFDDLAQRYGAVVCAAHLGLVRGAVEELGASVATDLSPYVQATACRTEVPFGRPEGW